MGCGDTVNIESSGALVPDVLFVQAVRVMRSKIQKMKNDTVKYLVEQDTTMVDV